MDSLRGRFSDRDIEEAQEYDLDNDDTGHEPPPSPVGQDERRMQVRAYNHWASLLGQRQFPSIEDLDPDNLPDFAPFSVLLDFTSGIEDPGIPYLGDKLAEECRADGGTIDRLSDVPSRSLLSRITDHYMQILANQAPIGFEAEFVNVRGATILYRGILLPFSSDDDTIDFIYGVINWKELADQKTSDALLLEIDQALNASLDHSHDDAPMTAWADGPADFAEPAATDHEAEDTACEDDILDLDSPIEPVLDGHFTLADDDMPASGTEDWPVPGFGLPQASHDDESDEDEAPAEIQPLFGDNGILARKTRSLSYLNPLAAAAVDRVDDAEEEDDYDTAAEGDYATFGAATGHDEIEVQAAETDVDDESGEIAFVAAPAPLGGSFIAPEPDHVTAEAVEDDMPELAGMPAGEMGLADWLASARELAQAAKGSEDRSRSALYTAIGRAYDFSLAALAEPDEFEAIVTDSGLTMQDRAPMTPVVKLVFGADYDKTRITEYASALSHGHRVGVGQGSLAAFLSAAPGGLKGVVQTERKLKREESGKVAEPRETPREALARKLRKLDHQPLSAVDPHGQEFTLLVARRLPTGEVVLLGEVTDDIAMLERAARKLIA